jgi:hypothetical protein
LDSNEFADYALWLQLANDPSQTEQSRELYRERMQQFMRSRIRDAFQAAVSSREPRR